MNTIYHYSVFAAAPGGGKQFAIVEGVSDPAEMQRIAASSGQPLTGFILYADSGLAEVRFFSPTKEKGSSDSGALVTGEHLRRTGAIQDRLIVDAGGEKLEVFYQDTKWWSNQPDTQVFPFDPNVDKLETLLESLGSHPIVHKLTSYFLRSGTDNKKNIVIPIFYRDWQWGSLDEIVPNFEELARYCQNVKVNGVIVMHNQPKPEAWAEMRFFAPAKGINEDNAGSFTVASLCGYMAGEPVNGMANGETSVRILQGSAMQKPSTLFTKFIADNGIATNIQVGGKVELLEVSNV